MFAKKKIDLYVSSVDGPLQHYHGTSLRKLSIKTSEWHGSWISPLWFMYKNSILHPELLLTLLEDSGYTLVASAIPYNAYCHQSTGCIFLIVSMVKSCWIYMITGFFSALAFLLGTSLFRGTLRKLSAAWLLAPGIRHTSKSKSASNNAHCISLDFVPDIDSATEEMY